MISPEILFQLVSTGLIFLLFITGAWKKSITNTVYTISVTLAFYALWSNCIWGATTLVLGAGVITMVVNLFRHENDPLLKDYVC